MNDTERLKEAFALSLDLHKNQTRKGSEVPYISHLMAVAAIVMRFGGNEDEVIAALLHDAVEDQGGQPTLEMIELKFGQQVASIVAGCSDTDQQPKPPWKERKEAYLEHLRKSDQSTTLVSAADKFHNAQDCLITYDEIGQSMWDMFKASKEQTKWYYQQLAEIYAIKAAEYPQINALLQQAIKMIQQLTALE